MIFWIYVDTFDDKGVPTPIYSTRIENPTLATLVNQNDYITLVRNQSDLPFTIDEASSIDVEIAEENCYMAMLNFSVVHALSDEDGLYERALFCECADNDPEYLAIKDKVVLELNFAEMQLLARNEMSKIENQDILEDFYGFRHAKAHRELEQFIGNAVRRGSNGQVSFQMESPSALGLGMLTEPKELLFASASGLYEYIFSSEFACVLPETEKIRELSTVERAWHDAEIEIAECARRAADSGQDGLTIKQIVEFLCWDSPLLSAKRTHDAGVPIEDILV